MDPDESYEAVRSYYRERVEKAIPKYVIGFLMLQFLGFTTFCSSGFFMSGDFFSSISANLIYAGIGLLLVSCLLAGWVGVVTLRSLSLLTWGWRLAGLFPWSVICAEAVLMSWTIWF